MSDVKNIHTIKDLKAWIANNELPGLERRPSVLFEESLARIHERFRTDGHTPYGTTFTLGLIQATSGRLAGKVAWLATINFRHQFTPDEEVVSALYFFPIDDDGKIVSIVFNPDATDDGTVTVQ